MAEDRGLTPGEIELARTIYHDAIDYSKVRIAHRKFIFFQPKRTIMAPMGTIHFNPQGDAYEEDFSKSFLGRQGDFIHELTHIWQWQSGIYLPVKRHPFCRYDYCLKPGQKFEKYGLEQQGEIARHTFLLRHGQPVLGAPPLPVYEALIPFARLGPPKR
jgi:hypothetical protein